jgi:hypothetical protein
MAAHKSPRTTQLYDRTRERLTREEVERIGLWAGTVSRFTKVPEITVELVNSAADLPALGVGDAIGGPTLAALGSRLRDLS